MHHLLSYSTTKKGSLTLQSMLIKGNKSQVSYLTDKVNSKHSGISVYCLTLKQLRGS